MDKIIKCLLIDDDIDDHEIFKMALQAVDTSILCIAMDGCRDAIQQLQDAAFTPVVIFIDMNMPVMNGFECLAEIKKIEHLQQVPVIIYSTFADPDKVDKMKALGAAGYFEKPSDFTVLKQSLSSLFQQYYPAHLKQ